MLRRLEDLKPFHKSPTYKYWRLLTYGTYRKLANYEVDPMWRMDFGRFYQDMGRKPGPDYILARLDRSAKYEPGNCVWVKP